MKKKGKIMNETVTVDKAISKGHKMINFPIIIIMFMIIGPTLYFGSQNLISIWIFIGGFVLALTLSLLWWSIMITKWKLWAFENVRNVHELKKRAIQEKFIWANDNIFDKTKIRTIKNKEKLNTLLAKFNQEDVFQDDLTIANETIIYYSKSTIIAEMVIMFMSFGIGIYSLLIDNSYIAGSFFSILGGYYAYKNYKKWTNKEPQIIINDKGIKTISTAFYSWDDIYNEEVISKISRKRTFFYLSYCHPNGVEFLQINEYDTNIRSLNKLLILYRGRNKQKKMSR